MMEQHHIETHIDAVLRVVISPICVCSISVPSESRAQGSCRMSFRLSLFVGSLTICLPLSCCLWRQGWRDASVMVWISFSNPSLAKQCEAFLNSVLTQAQALCFLQSNFVKRIRLIIQNSLNSLRHLGLIVALFPSDVNPLCKTQSNWGTTAKQKAEKPMNILYNKLEDKEAPPRPIHTTLSMIGEHTGSLYA